MHALRLALLPVVLWSCAPRVSANSDLDRPPSPPLLASQPSRPAPARAQSSSPALDQAIVAALRPDYSRSRPAGDEPDGPIPALVREPSPVALAEPEPDTGARLPPETIQRVVRASSGRFRGCYQRALTRDPETDGHIVTLFVIGADGLVQLAQEERTTLSDRLVRECVQRAFFELQFPKPPGAQPITVIYPMRFGHGPTPPFDLPSASRSAEPPPPGFAERMRSGIPVPPDPVVMPFEDAAPPPTSSCTAGDPMCAD